ncbi:uncharacterized protein IWZ02DRAFT_35836 [Phyllosticta citriasiana]|uniref:BZIP domain-containing protein n=1 Tax=Phyllosticta citriasiana TaxID=595635 RepID=A0ABR1K969_9PEZI
MEPEGLEQPATKKRTRNVATAGDASASKSKKQRGRPKVDTQDETAADRRRTQIRLAQRAYRQRKEMTINSLQHQVEHLQSVIDGMHNSFLHFNDQVRASDIASLRPDLASDLQQTREALNQLVQTAKVVGEDHGDSDDADNPASCQDRPRQEPPRQERVVANLSSRSYEEMIPPQQNRIGERTAQQQASYQQMGMGYLLADDTLDMEIAQNIGSSSNEDVLAPSTLALRSAVGATASDSPPIPFLPASLFPGGSALQASGSRGSCSTSESPRRSVASDSHGYGINPPSPQFNFSPSLATSPEIQLPYTYSFQETTFARRLQRACLERGFHLLSTSQLRPGAFQRVFRICRHYATRDEIQRQFRALLQQSVLEPIEFLNSPFIHLGGAGTHYPQRDGNGNIIPRKTDWNVRRIGPWATRDEMDQIRAGLHPQISWSRELEEDLRQYDGEWLDSHDVEGYLEELGIRIDAQASFAEAAVKTLDALAKGQLRGMGGTVHPDSEVAALDESLDPCAPNHLSARQAQTSPQVVPSSERTTTTSTDSASLTRSDRSPSGGPPSTPSTQPLDDYPMGFTGAAISPESRTNKTSPDPWGQLYDFDFSWVGGEPFGPNGHTTASASVEVVGQWRERRTVTIDVQRFINGLIKRSVCIGRGPGFRRGDVNYALRASVIEAF